jgi:hypothetical protein
MLEDGSQTLFLVLHDDVQCSLISLDLIRVVLDFSALNRSQLGRQMIPKKAHG